MENNNKSSRNRILESLRDVTGVGFTVLGLAAVAGVLFAHWILRMLGTAIEAIIASASLHFSAVFTLPEVLIITALVIIATFILAVWRNSYYRRNKRPQQRSSNQVSQQSQRSNNVGMQAPRRRSQALPRFDLEDGR